MARDLLARSSVQSRAKRLAITVRQSGWYYLEIKMATPHNTTYQLRISKLSP